ncbi:hypothetical protein FDH01_gp099 [Acinetobacter phage vB_AbaM_ME3]|uniref:Uncharacterized protein n=1 Tax=Acinetobacter phage vB_AbaM_ME3 TaxID=1837876 RepID=A0A172Q070_9CAUD|nr:hypothetical protein FDH01_gp099 [Acinetobacter phage vB_AbaM_ME3]AND75260.1 hypothetical protein ME3_99 [Acinetobacter phage vB_AbaM_ME3]
MVERRIPTSSFERSCLSILSKFNYKEIIPMTINSNNTDGISIGDFDFDGVFSTILDTEPQGARIRDLESYVTTTRSPNYYYTTNSITPPEFSYSFPRPLEERFSGLEGLVEVLNNTIQMLILEINELKKKRQDDNR